MQAHLVKRGLTEAKPKEIDLIIKRNFVEAESHPRKIEQNKKNKENQQKLELSHCLGRCSYAQKEYLMVCMLLLVFKFILVFLFGNLLILLQLQEDSSVPIGQTDKWLTTHEHIDGTIWESAKSKYVSIMFNYLQYIILALLHQDNLFICI